MANERCPSCQAVVRAGDPWCTLCWTDLRPAPAPVRVPEPVLAAAAVAVTDIAVDPLSAPLAVVLGEAPAPAAAAAPAAEETPVPTWPCVQCGARNAIDDDRCNTCTTPFGGRIRRLDDVKSQRRKVLMLGLGAVGAFLLLLGAITFVATDTSNAKNDKAPPGVNFQPGRLSD